MKIQNYSICLDDLFAASKSGHVSITTAKNGKKYAQLSVIENEEPDKYGNDFSVGLYDKEAKKTTYIGNGKKYKAQQQAAKPQTPISNQPEDVNDDLPF